MAQNGPSLSKATYPAKPAPAPSDDELIRRKKLVDFNEKQRVEREADEETRKQALLDEIKRTGRVRLR